MCGVNRNAGERGYCKMTSDVYVARVGLHKWEEPPISGTRGSGTVFFSGCSLGCIYCQNRLISHGEVGNCMSISELADSYISLQNMGAHNINLVTPTHFAPSIASSLEIAKKRGMSIPVVYNTGSFESERVIDLLKDWVDVWLPDLKYYKKETAAKYSNAPTLNDVSRRNIEKMVEAAGEISFNSEGIMTRGVIVRILLLPMHLAEAKLNLKYLFETFGNKIYISLMSQYTPIENVPPPLNRRVTESEYDELVRYAEKLGITQAFVQDSSSASETFIPDFLGNV